MTEFQQAIANFVKTQPNHMASLWLIAQAVFPKRWTKDNPSNARSGRGALIGHIRRVAENCEGFIFLPGSDRRDAGTAVYHGPDR